MESYNHNIDVFTHITRGWDANAVYYPRYNITSISSAPTAIDCDIGADSKVILIYHASSVFHCDIHQSHTHTHKLNRDRYQSGGR